MRGGHVTDLARQPPQAGAVGLGQPARGAVGVHPERIGYVAEELRHGRGDVALPHKQGVGFGEPAPLREPPLPLTRRARQQRELTLAEDGCAAAGAAARLRRARVSR